MSKKDAWQREPGAHEIEVKGRKYRNLVRFTRPCASCGERFGIYVSQAVADGTKSNNNFALKNCEKHRRQTMANDELTKELETLRTWKATVSEELKGYDQLSRDYTALFAELQPLKAELATLKATYQLQPAMEAVRNKFPWDKK